MQSNTSENFGELWTVESTIQPKCGLRIPNIQFPQKQLLVRLYHYWIADMWVYPNETERIRVWIPGVGFGAPGYFRLSYAVPGATIEGSFEGFKRARERI